MHADVTFVSSFTHSEKGSQTVPSVFVILSLRDLRQLAINGHDLYRPGPLLLVALPGERLQFAYGDRRLNWVIGCHCEALAADPDPARCRLLWGKEWLRLPRVCALRPGEVAGFTAQYEGMRQRLAAPTAANRCSVGLGVGTLLRRMLDDEAVTTPPTPAGRLRQLLDDPANGEADLEALSGRCHYSAKHLRLLFKREFQISPKQYRDRQRITQAMEMLACTDMSVKEIAATLGFKHVSHFCLAFKRATGRSATAAKRKRA